MRRYTGKLQKFKAHIMNARLYWKWRNKRYEEDIHLGRRTSRKDGI